MKVGFVSSALVLAVLAVVACSSDSESPGNGATNNPTPDAGNTKPDGGGNKGDDDDDVIGDTDAGKDAGPTTRPAPVFLADADYTDLITIDAKFPYGVTQRHEADADIASSKWGSHGGPMVTLGIYGGPGDPTVVTWTLPADAKGAATSKEKPFKKANSLPADFSYGADGMVDLPFGSLSLLDYTEPGSPYPGEALIYDEVFQTVKSRAKTNGFYSGAGLADGNNGLLVYTALSPLAAQASTTNDNGLYVTGICAGEFFSTGCAASRKLFGWKGNSGPVVTDIHGNVFVGASLSAGTTSDAIYGLGKKEVTGGAATTARALAEVDSTGTATLTALAPEGSANGWLLALGYAENAAIYAAPYTEKGDAVEKGTALVDKAITRATGIDSLSVFSDAEGDLWLAVVKGDKGTFLELRRK